MRLSLTQHRNPGNSSPLKLRRRAASRDVCDVIGAGFGYRPHGITAAYDYNRLAVGGFSYRASDSDCALVKGRLFKDSHRTIPDDGLRVFQSIREMHHRLDSAAD